MAKFKIFNIQLLPNDGADEVGMRGYKKLFSKLREVNKDHLRKKTHLEFHYHVSGEIYFGPQDFSFTPGFVSGHFVRYRNTERVTDLATGRAVYQAASGRGGVTTKKEFPFVFDASRHYFAIDNAVDINTEKFFTALHQMLDPIAQLEFPHHKLTINLVSKRNELENVFRTAVSYKTVKIHLNGPNGSDALDVLGEMRDARMQTLGLDVSGGTGRMTQLPEFVKMILRSVPGHGWSVMTYFVAAMVAGDQQERMHQYDSREQPQTFVVRHSGTGESSESDFLARVADRLSGLDLDVEANYAEGEGDVD